MTKLSTFLSSVLLITTSSAVFAGPIEGVVVKQQMSTGVNRKVYVANQESGIVKNVVTTKALMPKIGSVVKFQKKLIVVGSANSAKLRGQVIASREGLYILKTSAGLLRIHSDGIKPIGIKIRVVVGVSVTGKLTERKAIITGSDPVIDLEDGTVVGKNDDGTIYINFGDPTDSDYGTDADSDGDITVVIKLSPKEANDIVVGSKVNIVATVETTTGVVTVVSVTPSDNTENNNNENNSGDGESSNSGAGNNSIPVPTSVPTPTPTPTPTGDDTTSGGGSNSNTDSTAGGGSDSTSGSGGSSGGNGTTDSNSGSKDNNGNGKNNNKKDKNNGNNNGCNGKGHINGNGKNCSK